VRKADQIAVVEEGVSFVLVTITLKLTAIKTIVEKGSHVELMALGGRYFELFNLQKEGFEE